MDKLPNEIEPESMFSGLKAWPIFVGVIADIVSTYVLGAILLFALLYRQFGPEIPDEALNNLSLIVDNLLLFTIMGTACTVFGGYVGSRMARSEEIRHGGWIGAVSLIFGVLLEFNSGSGQEYPRWFTVVSVALVIPAGVLGGYLAKIKKNLRNNKIIRRPS